LEFVPLACRDVNQTHQLRRLLRPATINRQHAVLELVQSSDHHAPDIVGI
jgi:hypothetical protein